tara:strand:- start:307 stop:1062 length:756 start_codon:yes stop_codon:yes gene_type:complete
MDEFTFKKTSVDPKYFIVEDVAGDNACCYRALANGLFHRSFYDTKDDIMLNLDEWNPFREDTYDNCLWGFDGEEQDSMARFIQDTILEFIIEHQDVKLDEISDAFEHYDMTFSQLIEMTHGLSIEEYCELYSIFSGDEAYITTEDGDIELAENRWGGLPEQIAFSYRFKIPIIVYACNKFSKRYNKIISGRIRNDKAEKGVRFTVVQCIGVEFIKTAPPIMLLWKKSVKGDHYMPLYQKYRDHTIKKDGTI